MGGQPADRRWFHGTRDQHLAEVTPFQLETDPHAAPELWRDAVEGWFANILPDMGTDDAITAQYLRQNALWWAEMGALTAFASTLFLTLTGNSRTTSMPRFTVRIRVFEPSGKFLIPTRR